MQPSKFRALRRMPRSLHAKPCSNWTPPSSTLERPTTRSRAKTRSAPGSGRVLRTCLQIRPASRSNMRRCTALETNCIDVSLGSVRRRALRTCPRCRPSLRNSSPSLHSCRRARRTTRKRRRLPRFRRLLRRVLRSNDTHLRRLLRSARSKSLHHRSEAQHPWDRHLGWRGCPEPHHALGAQRRCQRPLGPEHRASLDLHPSPPNRRRKRSTRQRHKDIEETRSCGR